jgi:hypothetical protein
MKKDLELDTYIETVLHFYENETDQEIEDIAKLLNKKLIDSIEREGVDLKVIKGNTMGSLF